MANYFNTLSLRDKLTQLGKCRFMDRSELPMAAILLKTGTLSLLAVAPKA